MRIFIILCLLCLPICHSAKAQSPKTKTQIKAEQHLLKLFNQNFANGPNKEDLVLVDPFAISNEGILSFSFHQNEANLTHKSEVHLNQVKSLFIDMVFSLKCNDFSIKHSIQSKDEFKEFQSDRNLFFLHIYGENDEKLISKLENALKKVLVYYEQK